MKVRELVEQLAALDQDATVLIIDDDGHYDHIDRACPSEDPPTDGSSEAWVVKAED